jgi:hypothetical protein
VLRLSAPIDPGTAATATRAIRASARTRELFIVILRWLSSAIVLARACFRLMSRFVSLPKHASNPRAIDCLRFADRGAPSARSAGTTAAAYRYVFVVAS